MAVIGHAVSEPHMYLSIHVPIPHHVILVVDEVKSYMYVTEVNYNYNTLVSFIHKQITTSAQIIWRSQTTRLNLPKYYVCPEDDGY